MRKWTLSLIWYGSGRDWRRELTTGPAHERRRFGERRPDRVYALADALDLAVGTFDRFGHIIVRWQSADLAGPDRGGMHAGVFGAVGRGAGGEAARLAKLD